MRFKIFTLFVIFLVYNSYVIAQKTNNGHNTNVEIYNIGKDYYNEKKYQLAINEFNKIIDDNPYFFNAFFKKSYSYYHLGKYNLALNEIERAYSSTNFDKKYFYMKAQFYDKLKKYQLAEYYLDIALILDRENSYYYNYRAGLHLEMQQYKKAIYDYDILLSLRPEMYSAYYTRGIAKYNLKRVKEACADWAFAYNENEACKRFFFYKCTKVNLDGVKTRSNKLEKTIKPKFSEIYDGRFDYFIAENIKYPLYSIRNNEEGMVLVKFTLTKKLTIENLSVIHSISDSLDTEALRLVNISQGKWIAPSIIDNDSVNVDIIVPIIFEIEEADNSNELLFDSLNYFNSKREYEKVIQISSELLKTNSFLYEVFLKRQVAFKNLNRNDSIYYEDFFNDIRNFKGIIYNQVRSFDKSVKLYYNKIWELTDKKNAEFIRIANWNRNENFIDGKYEDYWITGELYSSGNYLNRGKDGEFKFYYKNETLKSKCYFNQNSSVGKWSIYHLNGKLSKSFEVDDYHFSDMQMYDSLGVALIIDGSGEFKHEYLDCLSFDTILVTGKYKKYEKDGFWKIFINNELVAFDQYKKNKFIQGLYIEGDKKTRVLQPAIGNWLLMPNELLRSEKLYQDECLKPDYYDFIFRDKESYLKGIN